MGWGVGGASATRGPGQSPVVLFNTRPTPGGRAVPVSDNEKETCGRPSTPARALEGNRRPLGGDRQRLEGDSGGL